MQTLLTGFGAFGRVISNPTERIVQALAFDCFAGQDITGYVLPVSYAQTTEILPALLEIGGRNGKPFDHIVMLGVAMGNSHWRVEEFGRKACGASKDIEGATSPRALLPDAPELLQSTLLNDQIAETLRAHAIPARLSVSAGGYLCNFALYHMLSIIQPMENPPIVGFLHVPADPQTFAPQLTSAPTFPLEMHMEAVQTLLETLTTIPTQRAVL